MSPNQPKKIDIKGFLERSDYFSKSPAVVVEKVASICEAKEVKRHAHLFSEEQQGQYIYFNATAIIQLYKINSAGKQVVVRILNPGALFGEVILFEQDTYPVSAQVIKSGTIFMISKNLFLGLLDNNGFRTAFIADLMRKQRYLAERINTLVSLDVEQRFFLFLKEHYGNKQTVAVSLTKKEIAESIGVSQETLSRLLRSLSEQKRITWRQNKLTLHDDFRKEWLTT